jgi:hypothetical protein
MRTDCAALCKLGELAPTMLSTTLSVALATFGTHAESGLPSASNRPSSTRWSSSAPLPICPAAKIQPPRSPRPRPSSFQRPLAHLTGGVFIASPLCFPRPRPSTTSSCFLITPSRPRRESLHRLAVRSPFVSLTPTREVHLTPGAHIVWVRGQMHGASPIRPGKRRGCGRLVLGFVRSPIEQTPAIPAL